MSTGSVVSLSIPSELAGYTMPHSSGDREKKILAGDDSARLESACVFFFAMLATSGKFGIVISTQIRNCLARRSFDFWEV